MHFPDISLLSRIRTSPKTIKDEELGEHTGEGEGEIEEEI